MRVVISWMVRWRKSDDSNRFLRHCKLWMVFGVVLWQVLAFVVFLMPSTTMYDGTKNEDEEGMNMYTNNNTNTVGLAVSSLSLSSSSSSHQPVEMIKIDENIAETTSLTNSDEHQKSGVDPLPSNDNNNSSLTIIKHHQEGNDTSLWTDQMQRMSVKAISRIRRTMQNNIHTIPTTTTNHVTTPISDTETATTTNVLMTPPSTSCPHPLAPNNISVSLLTQSSVSRLRTLDVTCQRWKAPIIVVIVVKEQEDPRNTTSESHQLQQYMTKWNQTCPQLQVILYHLDSETEGTPETYPINTLRNIALEAVSTSHILMIDVDFIPSHRLDRMIQLTILKQQRQRHQQRQQQPRNATTASSDDLNHNAIVIPAFDRRVEPLCETNELCAQLLHNDSKFIPSNFEEMQHCYLKSKHCIVFDGDIHPPGHSSTRTHLWLQRKWFVPTSDAPETSNNRTDISVDNNNRRNKSTIKHEETNQILRTIPCFDSIMYEPYVVLRWCPISKSLKPAIQTITAPTNRNDVRSIPYIAPVAPYYDERFLGYGHNKIQFMAHIRWMGYHFVVLPKGGFLVHSPHVMSSQKSIWLKGDNELRRNNTNLFDSFIDELDLIYGNDTTASMGEKHTGNRTYYRECVKPNVTTKTTTTRVAASTKPIYQEPKWQWDNLIHMRAPSSRRIRRTIHNNIHTMRNNHNSTVNVTFGNETNIFMPSTSCPHNLAGSNISVSLLTQSSISRLRTLDVTCQRWKSPIIVVIVVSDPLDASSTALLQGHFAKWNNTCQQLQVIMYHLDNETEGTPESYPINSVRNVALEAVTTSHLLMVDVDFIPSQGLDRMIEATIVDQHERVATERNSSTIVEYDNFGHEIEREAIVIPAFDRRVKHPCQSIELCAQLLQNNSKFIPSNFRELRHCYFKTKNCIVFDGDINDIGHSSTRTNLWLEKKWYEPDDVALQNDHGNSTNATVDNATTTRAPETKKMIRTLPCFDSLAYEPYVVLRWCPISSSSATRPIIAPVAPYYDERFLGYGHNKIQFMAHIRWMGYRFSVLPNGGFLVHSPHVMSSQKSVWLNGDNELRRNNTNLYDAFINELDSIYYGTVAPEVKEENSDRIYPRECPRPNATVAINLDGVQSKNGTSS